MMYFMFNVQSGEHIIPREKLIKKMFWKMSLCPPAKAFPNVS